MTLDEKRAEAAENAMTQLRFSVIPTLERVIEGTPTGPVRDSLTTANIILHLIRDGGTIDTNAVIGEALKQYNEE